LSGFVNSDLVGKPHDIEVLSTHTQALENLKDHVERIPCVIGGKEYYPEPRTMRTQVAPYDHKRVVAEFHPATPVSLLSQAFVMLNTVSIYTPVPYTACSMPSI